MLDFIKQLWFYKKENNKNLTKNDDLVEKEEDKKKLTKNDDLAEKKDKKKDTCDDPLKENFFFLT